MPSSFDDHIRDQFQQYEPEVPADLWNRIQGERDRRRPVAWLFPKKGIWAVALLLLVAGGAGYWYQQQQNKIVSATDDTKASINTVATGRTDTHETPVSASPAANGQGNTPVSEKDAAATSDRPATDHPASIPADRNRMENRSQPTAGVLSTESGNANTATGAQPVAGHATHRNNNPTATNQRNTTPTHKRNNELTPLAGNDEVAATETTNKPLATSRNKTKQTNKGKYRVNITAAVPDEPSETMEASDASAALLMEQQSLQQQVRSLSLIQQEHSVTAALKQQPTPKVHIPCPERIGPGNRKYVEWYVGPDYALRSFNDTASSAYLQQRKASTRYQSAFSAGLRYTKVFANAMSFRTGVNFSQINEKFTYVQGNIVQLTYILNDAGDTIGSFSSTATRYKTTHNRYKTIDIPLLLGYEWGDGRLHANINAGLIVNVYSWQKGDVLDVNYKPVSITTGESSSPYQFKSNIGLGFTGAASIYYKLTDRWQLLAEPYFRYNLSSVTKSDITLKQKFTTIGLRLGLRFDF